MFYGIIQHQSKLKLLNQPKHDDNKQHLPVFFTSKRAPNKTSALANLPGVASRFGKRKVQKAMGAVAVEVAILGCPS